MRVAQFLYSLGHRAICTGGTGQALAARQASRQSCLSVSAGPALTQPPLASLIASERAAAGEPQQLSSDPVSSVQLQRGAISNWGRLAVHPFPACLDTCPLIWSTAPAAGGCARGGYLVSDCSLASPGCIAEVRWDPALDVTWDRLGRLDIFHIQTPEIPSLVLDVLLNNRCCSTSHRTVRLTLSSLALALPKFNPSRCRYNFHSFFSPDAQSLYTGLSPS